MIRPIHRVILCASCGLVALALTRPCAAHFLWIKTISHNGQPHAFLYFGENALDEAYKLPESLADAKVWRRSAEGERKELATESLETDDRIGRIAPLADDEPYVLEASEQYGVYGTALLAYSAKHVHTDSKEQLNKAGPSKKLPIDIVPRVEGDRLELTLLWDGKPQAGSEISVSVGDAEAVEKTTDQDGRATFQPEGDGVLSVLASHTDKQSNGKLDDKSYDRGLHYASLTIDWPIAAKPDASDTSSAEPRAPPLPEPLSSFGAAVVDGWLYVYGGHIGTEHDHSAANLSNHFRRIKIDGGSEWEELPMQTPLQGLALVAHDGKLYRVGGMNALNPTVEDDEDLHSTAGFSQFDPATLEWTELAPLPARRSSHNAVVIGDRLYVVGGWTLGGEEDRTWQNEVLIYDFAKPQAAWQTEAQPFNRRALAASHWDGKLVALGGLDDEGEVSQRVDFFDTDSGTWSEGPELPGAGVSGFGISAWNLDGRLYVSGLRGILFRLNDGASDWQEVTRLAKPRFFHQLLPADGGLLAVGGASRRGHIAEIEWIQLGE